MTQPVPTSPTGPPPPFPAPSSSVVVTPTPIAVRPTPNDPNDAQNISKIIQSSIHNGSCSTINTNHNNNHSSDKRRFGDDQLSLTVVKSNHKEDVVKNVDEKQHHRSRRKTKTSNVTAPPTAAAVVVVAKPNQHKHTNGLSSNADKIINCISLVNGDDNYDEVQIESWKKENQVTRSLVFKEIRKPGRDFKGLYQQLDNIKGSFEMRFSFIQMCINEADRFRRKHMASCIEEWWEKQCDVKVSS